MRGSPRCPNLHPGQLPGRGSAGVGRSAPSRRALRIQVLPAATSGISQGWEQLVSVETSPKPAISGSMTQKEPCPADFMDRAYRKIFLSHSL